MLDKLKAIFYRPDFFRQQTFTGGQAFSFYSLSILGLLIGLSLLLIPAAWGVNRYFESAEWREEKAIIKNLYPDDLVLTFDGGKLTTNQSDPVVIPFPVEWREEGRHRGGCRGKRCTRDELPTNLLVIDRSVIISRPAIAERDTVFLANEDEIGFHNPNRGDTRIFALAEAKFDRKIEITGASFDYWVDRIASLIQTAVLLLIVTLPLLMFFGLWIGYSLYTLFGALVVWLAAHIRGHRLSYGRAYLSALYLLPAPFLSCFVLLSTGSHFPFLFTLTLFAMALLNFPKTTGHQHVEEAEKLPAPVKVTRTDASLAPKATGTEPVEGEKK